MAKARLDKKTYQLRSRALRERLVQLQLQL
jgi:hypothetical protein